MPMYRGGSPLITMLSGGFTPASFSGLGIWLDAQDLGSITGSDVSEWRDKSGNRNHAVQATGSLQPLYTASGINSKPAIQFYDDSTTKILIAPDSASLAYTQYSAFCVYKRNTDLAAAEQLFGQYNTTGNQRSMRGIVLSSDAVQVAQTTDGTSGTVSAANTVNTVAAGASGIMDFYYNGTNAIVVLNNDTANQGSVAVASVFAGTGGFAIGAREGAADPFSGWIGEVIFYTRLLTTAERLQVLRYLSAKWAITIS